MLLTYKTKAILSLIGLSDPGQVVFALNYHVHNHFREVLSLKHYVPNVFTFKFAFSGKEMWIMCLSTYPTWNEKFMKQVTWWTN